MNTLQFSKEALFTLVEQCRRKGDTFRPVFWTVSPNPNTMIATMARAVSQSGQAPGKWVNRKIKYGNLRQQLQYEYCIKFIRSIEDYVNQFGQYSLVGSAELNKSGDIHLHFLIWADQLKTETDLAILRREILNAPMTQQNITRKQVDYMNNIVWMTDPLESVISYMSKDNSMNVNYFPNFYIKPT